MRSMNSTSSQRYDFGRMKPWTNFWQSYSAELGWLSNHCLNVGWDARSYPGCHNKTAYLGFVQDGDHDYNTTSNPCSDCNDRRQVTRGTRRGTRTSEHKSFLRVWPSLWNCWLQLKWPGSHSEKLLGEPMRFYQCSEVGHMARDFPGKGDRNEKALIHSPDNI